MKSYLVTYPDGSRMIWRGDIQNVGHLTWLCREGKRLWTVPSDTIRKLDPIEALVYESEGVRAL